MYFQAMKLGDVDVLLLSIVALGQPYDKTKSRGCHWVGNHKVHARPAHCSAIDNLKGEALNVWGVESCNHPTVMVLKYAKGIKQRIRQHDSW